MNAAAVPSEFQELACHCGEPVFFGFDGDPTHHRGMCARCDSVRCDAYPGACRADMPTADDRLAEAEATVARLQQVMIAAVDAHSGEAWRDAWAAISMEAFKARAALSGGAS